MIIFHRFGNVNNFNYSINDSIIERVDQIKDLGVILDEKLNFKAHIESMIAKARSRLAWIKRFANEFNDPYTIKIIFFSFVVPILEYGSQVWNTHNIGQTKRFESVQKQFLLYALRRFRWGDGFHLPKYEHRLLLLQMISLENHRNVAQVMFVLKLIKGEICSDALLQKIQFRVPYHSIRNIQFLRIVTLNHGYQKFMPLKKLIETFNKYYNEKELDKFVIDFNVSSEVVKKRLIELFKKPMD